MVKQDARKTLSVCYLSHPQFYDWMWRLSKVPFWCLFPQICLGSYSARIFVSKLSARRCAQNQLQIQERLCPTNDAVGVSFVSSFSYFKQSQLMFNLLRNVRKANECEKLLLLFFSSQTFVLKFMPYDWYFHWHSLEENFLFRYVGCVGGCDDTLRELLDLKDLTRLPSDSGRNY